MMATSSSVRINGRGVRFIRPGHSSIALVGNGSLAPLIGGARGWRMLRCVPERGALCRIVAPGAPPGALSIRVLPFDGPAYTSLPAHANSSREALLEIQRALGGDCPDSSTGRTVLLGQQLRGGGAPPPALAWDVSSCNLLGAGVDLLFIPYRGELYALSKPIPLQMVLALSILTMIVAIVLAHNLEFALGTSRSPTRAATTLVATTALLLSSLFASGQPWDILQPYVTLEDRLACIAVVSYVAYYTARVSVDATAHHYACLLLAAKQRGQNEEEAVRSTRGAKPPNASPTDPPLVGHAWAAPVSPVNPVLGSMSMASMRLFSTMDNPYTVGILFLLSTRLLHKLAMRSASSRGSTRFRGGLEAADIVADSALASVLAYAGLVPQYRSDPIVVSLVVMQGAYAALTLSRVMAGMSSERSSALEGGGGEPSCTGS
jgi:hypothetical protein